MAKRTRIHEFKPGGIVLPADAQAFGVVKEMIAEEVFHPLMRVERVEERPGRPPIVTVSPYFSKSTKTYCISAELLDHPRNVSLELAKWLRTLANSKESSGPA